MALTARIEAITPPDEIYLSPSAWLAVNQAEVRTTSVGSFALKGFGEPVPIYRIEQVRAESSSPVRRVKGWQVPAGTRACGR